MTKTPALSAVLLIALPVCLGSCATLINSSTQEIRIGSEKRISQVSIDSSLALRPMPADGKSAINAFAVGRGREPLLIHLRLDTTRKDLVLRPASSFAYWINIYFNLGLGMLVDKNNSKHYAYPCWSYLYAHDTTIYRRRFAPIPKGSLRLTLGLPLINVFSLRSPGKQYNNGGIFGIEGGLDYFYRTDRYLSLSAGAATDLPWVDKKSVPLNGYDSMANVFYTSLRANRVLGSFDIGYGIALSGMEITRTHYHDSTHSNSSSTNIALGASLSLQYRIARNLRISALYQPAFWSSNLLPAWHYQHYLSIGLAWKFRM